MIIMSLLKKRDYIHSHLHQIGEDLINEVYQKMNSHLENDPVIGYDESGKVIKKSQLMADLKEAESQIERGEYLTIEDLEKESEQW
ncbi:MAG: hypothetical protein ABFS10_11445 [Bacteroidota bacterium]